MGRFFGQSGLQTEAGQKRLMHSLPLVIDQTLQGQTELPLCEFSTGFSFDWHYECANEQQVIFGDISLEPGNRRRAAAAVRTQ